MKRAWKQLGKDSGSALLEMALTSIIYLTVLLGIFMVFMAAYSYHYVSYAAREGARYAVVRGSDCYIDTNNTGMPGCTTNSGAVQTDVQNYIYDLNFPGINVADLGVTVSWLQATNSQTSSGANTTTWVACDPTTLPTIPCNSPGNQVQVKVTYTNPLSIPFIPAIPLNLTSTSTMVISQ